MLRCPLSPLRLGFDIARRSCFRRTISRSRRRPPCMAAAASRRHFRVLGIETSWVTTTNASINTHPNPRRGQRSTRPCRSGRHCRIRSCRFSHLGDGNTSSARPAHSGTPCRYGILCHRATCHFDHPSTDDNAEVGEGDDDTVNEDKEDVVDEEVGDKARDDFVRRVCRYGDRCHDALCHFKHPHDDDIDDEEIIEITASGDPDPVLEDEYSRLHNNFVVPEWSARVADGTVVSRRSSAFVRRVTQRWWRHMDDAHQQLQLANDSSWDEEEEENPKRDSKIVVVNGSDPACEVGRRRLYQQLQSAKCPVVRSLRAKLHQMAVKALSRKRAAALRRRQPDLVLEVLRGAHQRFLSVADASRILGLLEEDTLRLYEQSLVAIAPPRPSGVSDTLTSGGMSDKEDRHTSTSTSSAASSATCSAGEEEENQHNELQAVQEASAHAKALRKQAGLDGEARVEAALLAAGIPRAAFKTEADLVAENEAARAASQPPPHARTPDILFVDDSIHVNGRRCAWVDSKNTVVLPGVSDPRQLTQLCQQIDAYCDLFGPGLIVWQRPHVQELTDQFACPKMVAQASMLCTSQLERVNKPTTTITLAEFMSMTATDRHRVDLSDPLDA